MTPVSRWLLLAIATWLPAGVFAAGDPARELAFGSVAMDIPAAMHKRLSPLTDYLTRELGLPVRLKLAPNLTTAVEDLARGAVDLAYLTPVAYLEAKTAGDIQLIAKTVTKGKSTFNLMVVVREDSPIRNMRELAGRRFAFGDRAAILQRAVVVGAGIALDELGDYQFIGHYDNIVRGVLNRDFDAGILKDTTAYAWAGKGIRILHTSPDLPPYNISSIRSLDPALRGKIRKALLRLDTKNPEHRTIIKTLDEDYDGFVDARDADYDIVRKLVAPFEKAK